MDTAGFYHYNGSTFDYAPTTVWLPDGQILRRDDPPAEPVAGWGWHDSEQAAYDAHGVSMPQPERARDELGRFVADDPTTPDVNEAWVISEQGE